jgi:hypothetical protein
MDKYLKAIENIKRKFGSEWIKPAMESVIEIAVQDYFVGGITREEYEELCTIYANTVCPKKI